MKFQRSCLLLLAACLSANAQEVVDHSAHLGMDNRMDHGAHNMTVDREGAVMNENFNTLPRDCTEISRDYQFTVQAGTAYANKKPGMIFGMSEPEIRVEPCSRVEITFINEDEVRHQWMVHGLPKYLYPAGMFHIEAVGGAQKTGTFIVPGDDQTFLLHCDLPQHMEKGMRGQLVVGKGSGNLWAINGISDDFIRSSYLPRHAGWWIAGVLLAGFALAHKLKAFK
jgi:FtsP/CotA-like multicopper oxidase with cupredoxin domain